MVLVFSTCFDLACNIALTGFGLLICLLLLVWLFGLQFGLGLGGVVISGLGCFQCLTVFVVC